MKTNQELIGNFNPNECRHIIAKFIKCQGRMKIDGSDIIARVTNFSEVYDHNTYGFVVAKLGMKEIQKAHQMRTDVYKIKFMFKSSNPVVLKNDVRGYIGLMNTKNWFE